MTASTPGEGLVLEALTVKYGGRVALDGLDLLAPPGAITGLLGPNGAGKTTAFNAANGLVRPAHGRVRLLGHDVTSASPARRARLGLGRTFQRMEICEGFTARENVALGPECRSVGGGLLRHLRASAADRAAIARATDEAIELCGVGPFAAQPAALLSTGQRRLVELARVVAGGYPVLLLDEPSSGLDEDETRRFGAVVRAVVAEQGTAVLLVEHDMALVMEVCSRLHVLDFGRLVYVGTPAEVQASPVVRAAYLGQADELDL